MGKLEKQTMQSSPTTSGLQYMYVGETKQQLSKHLNGHRSDTNCKYDLSISRHLRL